MSAPTVEDDLAAVEKVIVLSPRQRDILDELVRDGASNQQIAKRLYVTEDTVKTHMKALLKKTGKPSRIALLVAVLKDELPLQVPRNVPL